MRRREILVFIGDVQSNGLYARLKRLGFTGLMLAYGGLSKRTSQKIKKLGLQLGVVIPALPGGDICPASREASLYLKDKIELVLGFEPDVVWLDHLRFEGQWEQAVRDLPGLHGSCRFCRGKERSRVIFALAKMARDKAADDIRLGYYGVPFTWDEHGEWLDFLGQDHQKLCQIFDFISPMVYHRMLGKPVSYIVEYVKYLSKLEVEAEILPIIQVKDMPGNLPDELKFDEFKQVVGEALGAASAGVAFFTLEYMVEKGWLAEFEKLIDGI